MSQKLTPWFSGDVKPVRVGVYRTKQPDGSLFFNKWDGKQWFYGYADAPRDASRYVLPARLLKCWRGLAQKP